MSDERKNLNDEMLDKDLLENVAGGDDGSTYEYHGSGQGPTISDPEHHKPKKPSQDERPKCPVCGTAKIGASYGGPKVCPVCQTPYAD